MRKHQIAKLLVPVTIAVMVFGFLSMAIAMSMGMGHCPVMPGATGCPSLSEGVAFSNHHIEGFQSMMVTTTAMASFIFLIIFAFSRIPSVQAPFISRRIQARWPLANGPPSPIASLLFWSALHNKFGDMAFFRVQRLVLA